MRIIVTPDDHKVNKEQFSFFVYDLNTKKLIHSELKHESLNCPSDLNKGRSSFRPFGIETDNNNIYIASNSKLAVFDTQTYKYKNNLDFPLFANTHQIVKSNDIFYVCNTAVNTIGIYSKEINHFNVISKTIDNNIKEFENCEERDLVHVNSLCDNKNFIYYCLHNLDLKQSEFWRLDKNTLTAEYLVDAGYCAHNIGIFKDVLYSLSSDTGEIIEYNLNTKKLKYYLAVDSEITFLRGLSIFNNKMYFGASNNFNVNPSIKQNCNILSFDFETKKIEHVLYLDDIYTITDLKIIN
jgi:hypothetical protein